MPDTLYRVDYIDGTASHLGQIEFLNIKGEWSAAVEEGRHRFITFQTLHGAIINTSTECLVALSVTDEASRASEQEFGEEINQEYKARKPKTWSPEDD